MATYKPGDRVRPTGYYLLKHAKRSKYAIHPKTANSVGLFVTLRPRPKTCRKGEYCTVRWFTGKKFPPYHDVLENMANIEPHGTKR